MNFHEFIEVNPKILVGKPVIKGTRLAVEFILDLLANGVSEAEIISSYPGLTPAQIRACVAYAAELVKNERVFPMAG
jgi:uncharacterized protein (DUF433 family)